MTEIIEDVVTRGEKGSSSYMDRLSEVHNVKSHNVH